MPGCCFRIEAMFLMDDLGKGGVSVTISHGFRGAWRQWSKDKIRVYWIIQLILNKFLIKIN